jgi:hypothetical protein
VGTKSRRWMATNLCQVMIEFLQCTKFYEGVLVKNAKGSCVESNEEKKVPTAAQMQRFGLLMSLNVVWSIRREYCSVKLDWTCWGMDWRALWLAITIGLDSGPQVGNVMKMQKKKATKKNACSTPCIFTVIVGRLL